MIDAPEDGSRAEGSDAATPLPPTAGDKKLAWKRVGTLLWRYAIPVLLLAQLGLELFIVMTHDAAPVAQAPPANYEAVESRTRLVWSANGLDGLFEAQVIPEGGDFDRPTVKKQTKKQNLLLPILDPATTYHWRIMHVSSGLYSNVMTFKTTPYGVSY